MPGAAARPALSGSGAEEELQTTQFTVFSEGTKFNSLWQAKEGKTHTFEMSGCLFSIFSLASFLMFSFYIFPDFFLTVYKPIYKLYIPQNLSGSIKTTYFPSE